jgi:signal transduction histidine kinase
VVDSLYYNGIYLPFVRNVTAETTVLIFALFQMVAVFLGTMEEIAAAKEAEQRLEMENTALEKRNLFRSELMAKMSHEMRTPLTVMSIYSQHAVKAIQNGNYDDESLQRLGAITREANRLAEMSSNILLMFRERGGVFVKSPFSIGELIEHTVLFYKPIMIKSHNKAEFHLPADLPPVFGNEDELTQVLYNLLVNADTHTKDGNITISAKTDGADVSVTVSDNGCGISPELLPHVFEKGRHGGHGSGYGLTICKELIEKHGGEIKINSVLKEGTDVTFTVPVWNGDEADG